MQIKIAKRNALQRLVLGGCALAIISSTGCKSGMSMPGASMFGWNKGPSAETLAGQGPTTTYPSPPSTEFAPNAVASNAAGTGQPTNSMAGINAGVPNTAAAANGFAGAPSYAGTNYGYTPSYPGTPPSYAGTPSNLGAPTTTPAANFAMPNGPSAQVATAAGTPSYGGPSGPSFGAAGIPAGYTTGGTPAQTNPYTVPTGTMPPTGGAVAPTPAIPGSTTGGGMAPGYRPGSTAGATSYPSTPFTSPNATIHR